MKYEIVFLILLLVVLSACTDRTEVETPDDAVQPEEIGCVDLCGNGNCEKYVCMGTGCPCAETKESCPEDCS